MLLDQTETAPFIFAVILHSPIIGGVNSFWHFGLQTSGMKSASNGGILNGSLQMLHVHVLLVALLGAGYMAEPGIDQHESRVAVWENAHYSGSVSNLLVTLSI